MKISATVITLNEAENIASCLESLSFADEIVVVDSGSTDRTEEICRAHPLVRFFCLPWEGFGKQKNLAAGLASHEWIVNIDADERVSPELAQAIAAADFSKYNGFRVSRENYFAGCRIKYCGWYPDYNLRLYRKRTCGFNERSVHESVQCGGPVGNLEGNLVHYSYTGIADYVARMDRYSLLAAEEVVKSGRRPGTTSIVTRPLFTFIKMYVFKKGFLEGYLGLLLSLLYANYTFLKYARAREILAKAQIKGG